MRTICVLLAVAACHGDEPKPVLPPPPAHVIDARAIDAPAPVAIDAAPPPPTCDSSMRAFRFGTITAPAGWCWRRTEEGDDQSGNLVDATGAMRARYTELSFDEKVGDVCADTAHANDVYDGGRAGVRYRTCEVVTDGRHRFCASFHGAANLCSAESETLTKLLHTIVQKP